MKKVRTINTFLKLMSSKSGEMNRHRSPGIYYSRRHPNSLGKVFLLTCEEHFSSTSDRYPKPERNSRDAMTTRHNMNTGDSRNSLDIRNPRGSNRSENSRKCRQLKNPCKLPNYDWSSCFNNYNSDKFKGTTLTPKDFGSDGKKTRGEQNNNNKYWKTSKV